MKTKLMIVGLLILGVTLIIRAPVVERRGFAAGAPSYQTVDCTQENQSCKRFDGSDGVCKLQYCATMDNPNNKCFVCAEPKTNANVMAAAARPNQTPS